MTVERWVTKECAEDYDNIAQDTNVKDIITADIYTATTRHRVKSPFGEHAKLQRVLDKCQRRTDNQDLYLRKRGVSQSIN